MANAVFPSGPTELQVWWSDLVRESMSPEMAVRYMEFARTLDVRPYLSQVRAPTLVLHRAGYRDVPVSVGRAIAAKIPDARFVAIDGDTGHPFCGDLTHLEKVRAFLDEGRPRGPAPEMPMAGAVHTILFTDMESSTATRQRLGDAKAQELLRAHNGIVRDALRTQGGSEIKHTGDGIMASFPSASGALECAIAIQRAVAERNESILRQAQDERQGQGKRQGQAAQAEPVEANAEPVEAQLRLYIGLNAGEPIAEEDDLFGTSVDLAKRICDHAGPGEIIVSDVVRQLAAGKGFLFSDRGDTALRGFEDPVRLYEVSWR
jgi:class 3 adenylate cyclase